MIDNDRAHHIRTWTVDTLTVIIDNTSHLYDAIHTAIDAALRAEYTPTQLHTLILHPTPENTPAVHRLIGNTVMAHLAAMITAARDDAPTRDLRDLLDILEQLLDTTDEAQARLLGHHYMPQETDARNARCHTECGPLTSARG